MVGGRDRRMEGWVEEWWEGGRDGGGWNGERGHVRKKHGL